MYEPGGGGGIHQKPQHSSPVRTSSAGRGHDDTSNRATVVDSQGPGPGHSLTYKGSDEFQSYVYQLIKSRLVQSVKDKLKTVLCLDIPKAKEVFTASGTFQFRFHGKSHQTQQSILKGVGGSGTSSLGQSMGGPSGSAGSAGGSAGGEARKDSRASILGLRRPSRRCVLVHLCFLYITLFLHLLYHCVCDSVSVIPCL